MLDSILEAITQLKTFILVAGAGILVVGATLLIICNKFSWNSYRRKFIGFFYRMNTWDVFGLSCCFIKIFLAISFLVAKGQVEVLHIVIFVVLKLCYIVHKHSVKGLLTDIGLTAISIIVMIIMNLLFNYLNEIIFDVRISIIMWMLGILLCLYSIYDLFCCCNNIIGKTQKTEG